MGGGCIGGGAGAEEGDVGLWNAGTMGCGDWNEKSSMLTDGGCSHCYLNVSISMR